MATSDDVESIRRLKARYFRLLDTKDWDALVEVFTDDITVDVAGSGEPSDVTAREFVDRVRSKLEGTITVHHGHMPEIDVTSGTTAVGIWSMEDKIWWPEGSPIRFMHGYGHYHDAYLRTDDGWRIAAMRLTRLHRQLES